MHSLFPIAVVVAVPLGLTALYLHSPANRVMEARGAAAADGASDR